MSLTRMAEDLAKEVSRLETQTMRLESQLAACNIVITDQQQKIKELKEKLTLKWLRHD